MSTPRSPLSSPRPPPPTLGAAKRRCCLIIYTGGTIGMKPGKNGELHPEPGYLEEVLSSLPELSHKDVPRYDVLAWADIMDSSDFSPECWITLAKQIEENYYNYDGFVILHGTDTMAYTASALSFMLENLGKCVILTGSMIPLAFPVSDAKRNLIVSMMTSVSVDIPEVCIFFNNVLLRGNRSKKVNPFSNDAFDSPNMLPLAEMGVQVNVKYDLTLPAPRRRFIVHTNLFSNIAVMILIPGFDDQCIRAFVSCCTQSNPVALILALYGSGNAPARKQSFIETLKMGIERGAVIVITSQCMKGSVDMSQYATGNILQQLGVIDGRDMTCEACVTKLAYLMGRGMRGSALKAAMQANLRGELTVQHAQAYNVDPTVVNKIESISDAMKRDDALTTLPIAPASPALITTIPTTSAHLHPAPLHITPSETPSPTKQYSPKHHSPPRKSKHTSVTNPVPSTSTSTSTSTQPQPRRKSKKKSVPVISSVPIHGSTPPRQASPYIIHPHGHENGVITNGTNGEQKSVPSGPIQSTPLTDPYLSMYNPYYQQQLLQHYAYAQMVNHYNGMNGEMAQNDGKKKNKTPAQSSDIMVNGPSTSDHLDHLPDLPLPPTAHSSRPSSRTQRPSSAGSNGTSTSTSKPSRKSTLGAHTARTTTTTSSSSSIPLRKARLHHVPTKLERR